MIVLLLAFSGSTIVFAYKGQYGILAGSLIPMYIVEMLVLAFSFSVYGVSKKDSRKSVRYGSLILALLTAVVLLVGILIQYALWN